MASLVAATSLKAETSRSNIILPTKSLGGPEGRSPLQGHPSPNVLPDRRSSVTSWAAEARNEYCCWYYCYHCYCYRYYYYFFYYYYYDYYDDYYYYY